MRSLLRRAVVLSVPECGVARFHVFSASDCGVQTLRCIGAAVAVQPSHITAPKAIRGRRGGAASRRRHRRDLKLGEIRKGS